MSSDQPINLLEDLKENAEQLHANWSISFPESEINFLIESEKELAIDGFFNSPVDRAGQPYPFLMIPFILTINTESEKPSIQSLQLFPDFKNLKITTNRSWPSDLDKTRLEKENKLYVNIQENMTYGKLSQFLDGVYKRLFPDISPKRDYEKLALFNVWMQIVQLISDSEQEKEKNSGVNN